MVGDIAQRAYRDSDLVETPEGLRMRHRHFPMSATPVCVHNPSDGFKLIMPTTHARVRLDDNGSPLFTGAVRPGTVRFVQPDEQVQFTALTAVDQLMIYIPGPIFRRQGSAQGLMMNGVCCPQIVPVITANYAVQRLLPLLELSTGMPIERRQSLVMGLATSLMALLLDPSLHRSQASERSLTDAEYDCVDRFAEARLGQHLSLAEWADTIGLSPGDFTRRFQQRTGVAPYTWFLDRRIAAAKRLMTQSDMPLVEIALDAGFCSQSHFTEAFRRRVGSTPGRWRKSQS